MCDISICVYIYIFRNKLMVGCPEAWWFADTPDPSSCCCFVFGGEGVPIDPRLKVTFAFEGKGQEIVVHDILVTLKSGTK